MATAIDTGAGFILGDAKVETVLKNRNDLQRPMGVERGAEEEEISVSWLYFKLCRINGNISPHCSWILSKRNSLKLSYLLQCRELVIQQGVLFKWSRPKNFECQNFLLACIWIFWDGPVKWDYL